MSKIAKTNLVYLENLVAERLRQAEWDAERRQLIEQQRQRREREREENQRRGQNRN